MTTHAVMVFGDENKAYEGLHALQALHADGSVTVWGTAVLQRDADGEVAILKGDDIEQRMAEVRDEFAERERKLERAREVTRQALQP
jgi:hypothetical protein